MATVAYWKQRAGIGFEDTKMRIKIRATNCSTLVLGEIDYPYLQAFLDERNSQSPARLTGELDACETTISMLLHAM